MKKQLFILSQYLLPHHLLSRLAGCVAECRVRWFKNAFTTWFAKRYQVDMSQALVEDVTAYEHFNAFFYIEIFGCSMLVECFASSLPCREFIFYSLTDCFINRSGSDVILLVVCEL